MSFKILDVGSGGFPCGDVNVDLFLNETPHAPFDVKKTPNFVRCDCTHLPFKDNAFEIVRAFHILEHLLFPPDFLNEARRVTNRILTIKVPDLNYQLQENLHHEHQLHLYTWSDSTLKNLLKKYFREVKIYKSYSNRRASFFRGYILKKMGVIGDVLGHVLKFFYYNEITAVCKK